MVLFVCLIPNRGARIGHQTHEHYCLVALCKKYGYHFVHHPFVCNSKQWNDVLRFDTLHTYQYEDVKHFKTISIQDVSDCSLQDIHKEPENIVLFDHICRNEHFFRNITQGLHDIFHQVRMEYRSRLKNSFPKMVTGDYICIHIRYGDVANDTSRVLDSTYFTNRYTHLIDTHKELGTLPVYIVTERNFQDHAILTKAIPSCIFVQGDEIEAFLYLVNCTYLLASRSGFSNLAYVLGGMKVLRPPCDWNVYWDNVLE